MAHARANTTLPDIPFESVLQSSRRLDRGDLKKWFNFTWTIVRGKMPTCIAYQTIFLKRNGAYYYFQIFVILEAVRFCQHEFELCLMGHSAVGVLLQLECATKHWYAFVAKLMSCECFLALRGAYTAGPVWTAVAACQSGVWGSSLPRYQTSTELVHEYGNSNHNQLECWRGQKI